MGVWGNGMAPFGQINAYGGKTKKWKNEIKVEVEK
jgi:hypothetical protein